MITRFEYSVLRIAVALLCAAFAGGATAEEPTSFAPTAELSQASDTDGFSALRWRAGVLTTYANPWSYAGAAMQSTRFAQDYFRKDVSAVVGVYRDQRRDTLAGVDIEAGVTRVSGHLRPVGDATLRMTTTLGTMVDLNASADLVETRKALDRGIGFTFLAANVEQQFGERFTLTGLAGWQHFSDGNSRPQLRARLIWLAVPDAGITLQLRYRQYWSREADVGGAYFNPENYQQWLGVVAIRKRYAGWIYSGALGAGQEFSSGAGSHASYLAETRAEGPIGANARLVLRAGYYRSAGFVDNPDYAYRLFGVALVVPLH